MNTNIKYGIALMVFLALAVPATRGQEVSRAEIIKQREATLSNIVVSVEQRFKNGTLKQSDLFKARYDLLHFQFEVASSTADKMSLQEKIVAVRETQQTVAKREHQVGVCDEIEVLRVTADLLAEKQLLAELKARK